MTAELTRTGSPGQEFAAAVFAAFGEDVTVSLPCALPATFPFAANRPRYTVRHLLKTREVTEPTGYLREEHRGSDTSGASYGATPEARFSTSISTAAITTLTASLSVPRGITANEQTLANVVDHRLIVRLCTVENDALLNGTEDGVIPGIRTLAGSRQAKPSTDLGRVITQTAALVEETGGSCDGVIGHPRLYWELVRNGLLGRLAEAGVRVSRTRMLPPDELILADFRAAFTLLDTLDSTMEIRRGAGADGQDLLIASVRIGLAVHLPQHVLLGTISW
ncbi:hypothetical protein JOF56_010387 [Kibdelosporangium banguiense]|uniref:Phage major capsid protein n=1 Tax=Kibdelosporangium banguiense TaxID=1365924 RepID=A0ABS4U015_9PSEU|nr:family 3 encapsulin nanocompartment shell protein [Kibdelosporangium banguiense]MBP2330002.1 hypothetical protein [Kibdelosporangium banguiense]